MRWPDHLVVGLLCVPYAWLTYRFRWLCDDAYISFHYARNWVTGAGLRFNAGAEPPVEGYSNFLWTAWCALIERLGLDVTFWAPATSFACGLVLCWCVYRTLRGHGAPRAACALGASTLAWAAPFFVWSTGGLETVPFALLLFLTLDRLVLRERGPAPVAAAAAGLGVALIRTEGVFWVLLLGGLAGFAALRRAGGRKRALRPVVLFLVLVLLPYVAYSALRYAYYGEVFSNTAYAKSGLPAAALLRGLRYVGAYFVTLATPIALLPAAYLSVRRGPRTAALCIVAVALAGAAYGVLTGGDFMTMFRFLVPTLVVMNALLVGWAIQALWGASAIRRGSGLVLGAALAGAGVLPAFDVHLTPERLRRSLHFRSEFPFLSERSYWELTRCNALRWAEFGRLLRERTREGDWIVLGPMGAAAYHADRPVYDLFGIVTPDVARREVKVLVAPGHDKRVSNQHFLAREPAILGVEAGSRTASEVRSLTQVYATQPFADRYVIEWVLLDPGNAGVCEDDRRRDGQGVYLVYLLRIDGGRDPARAWREAQSAALALR
jgi:arabinofuranosyltransferase